MSTDSTESNQIPQSPGGPESPEGMEAIQAVVDRVSSYQDAAPERTIEKELREGFAEVGVEVSDADVTKLADAIDSDQASVQAAEVLS